MRAIRPAFLALGLAPAAAFGQSPVFWNPAPLDGHLELQGSLGGWSRDVPPQPSLLLAVPGDPRPSRPPEMGGWEYWEREQKDREEAILQRVKARMPGEPPTRWALLKLLEWDAEAPEEEARPVAKPGELAFLARYAGIRAQVEEELKRAEEARYRDLRYWFNGRAGDVRAELNRPWGLYLEPQAGENRLEVLERATGQRESRTWWHEAAAGPRLQVLVEGGEVKVLEPGGALSSATSFFRRANPTPGTYTLSWGSYRATEHHWWSPEDAAPVTLVVDVLIDAGTDRERHLRFQSLCLPGGGERVLGSFDVEN